MLKAIFSLHSPLGIKLKFTTLNLDPWSKDVGASAIQRLAEIIHRAHNRAGGPRPLKKHMQLS